MVIQLSPKLEEKISALIASGHYSNAVEVVEDAIELLEHREEHLQWLREEVQIGLDQEARGELVDYTPDFMKRLQREANERTRLGLPVKDAVKP